MKQPPELVGRAYRFSLAALRFYRKLPKSPDAQVPGVQFLKSRNLHLVELSRISARPLASRVHCQARNSNRRIGRVSWVVGIHERRRHRCRRSPSGRRERDLRNVDGVSHKRPTQLDVSPPFYFLLFTFHFHISSPLPRCACGVCSARSAGDTSCMGCTRTED